MKPDLTEKERADIALSYISQGFSAIPTRHDSKLPSVRWGAFRYKYADREVFSRGKFNIAIVTGRLSNLFVIDVDSYKTDEALAILTELGINIENAETPVVRTPSGGYHIWFEMPETLLRSRNNLEPGIDVRGENGYVLVPPSVVDGKPYTFLNVKRIDNLRKALKPLPKEFLEAYGETLKAE